MPRIRSIKPGFFTNDALGELAPLGRLLFAGLWCIADRRGRLEDRPKRIKAEVLPYDADADVDGLLSDLESRGFIARYTAGDARLIQVVNFEKHQTPHIKEAESSLPAPCQSGASPVPSLYMSHAGTDSASDEPDDKTVSAIQIPITGSTDPDPVQTPTTNGRVPRETARYASLWLSVFAEEPDPKQLAAICAATAMLDPPASDDRLHDALDALHQRMDAGTHIGNLKGYFGSILRETPEIRQIIPPRVDVQDLMRRPRPEARPDFGPQGAP